ncbi:putative Ig domain-containing protein [Ideonella sp.]|uniref:putative Ig domain-containing protein n=1 Tax=Ideonella sp. TaxID=1929293 RepID=UPI0035B35100
MNHVYRSLWNDVTRTFVAVSEVARSHGHRSASRRTGGAAEAVEATSAARARPLVLEPRLMFDAAAVVAAADMAHAGQIVDTGVAERSHAAVLAEAAQRLVQAVPAAGYREHEKAIGVAPRGEAAAAPAPTGEEAPEGVLAQSFSQGTLPLTDSGTANFSFVQVGDFDVDGDIDILTQEGGSATAVTLWSNDGSGSYTSSTAIGAGVTGLNISFSSVRLGDYDNDGDLDYYQRISGAGNDLYFVNNGSGVFSAGTAPLTDSGTTNQAFIQAFDIDNDGDVDILTQDGGSATAVTLWTNDGSGSFTSSEVIAAGVTNLNISFSSVRIADYDNDGDLDYYQRVSGAANDIFYANNGSGGLSAGTTPLTDSGTTNQAFIQVGDFDNDGDTDILTQEGGSATAVTLWSNDGSGSYSSSEAIAAGVTGLNISFTSVRIGDYNNDGDVDYYQRISGAGNDLFFQNDNAPPTLTSFTPSANGNAGPSDNLVLNFSHSVALSQGSGTITIRVDDGDGNFGNDVVFETFSASDGRVSLTGDSTTSTVTINPSGTFVSGKDYYVVVSSTAFVDADGKGFVTKVGNRFHAGLPDPAINRAGNSLDALADRTLMSFSVVSTDATPVLTNLNGDSVAWAGVGSTVLLDASGDSTASDAEFDALNGGNGDWAGASLTVSRSSSAISNDVFGFSLAGATFTVSGANLQSGGQTFATFTNTGGVLTISFTSSGTASTTALVQDVMRHITYRNDTPYGDAAIRFSMSDGNTSTTADVTVTSDTIYVDNTTDTAAIDVSNGVSLSEAVGIAAADATGSQTLIFSSAFTSTMTMAGDLSISESLTVNADSASGLVISGSTITLGGGTTLSLTNASGTVTIASTLAGTGALAKVGAGTLALTSTGNEAGMSGGIGVTGGTLQIGDDNYLSSGTLTLDGGTLTNASSACTIDNAIAIGSSGCTINVGGGGGATLMSLTGVISGTGTLLKNGQAILQLDGNNTFSGALSITAGTVIANHANALGTTAGSTTVASGATVRVTGGLTVAEAFTIAGTGKTVSGVDYGALHLVSGSSTLSGIVTLSGDANISAASGATLTLSGALSGGAFNLNKTDAGTLALSNTGNEAGLTGGTTITAGTLSIGSDDHLAGGTLTLAGGTLTNSAIVTIDNAIDVTVGSTISTASDMTLSGVVSGSAALTKSGASTLTLSASNTYSGAFSVTAGTLTLSGGAALADTATVALSSGTTLSLSNNETIGALSGAGSVSLSSNTLTVSQSTDTTLSGAISGTGGLTKAGSGTLTLSGSNTYTGATTVSAGGLTLGAVGGTLADSTAVTVASGATLTLGDDETIAVLSGAGTVAVGSHVLTVGINGDSSTFSGGITGSGTLTLDGSGTLTLSGTNSAQSWALNVLSGGTVAIAGDANLGTGTVQLNGGTLSVTGDTTVDNTVTLGVNDGSVSVGSGRAVSLSGAIGGTGSLVKTGSGSLTLSGSNNYSGTTTVSAGTLAVASDGNLGAGSLALSAGSTLQVTGATTIDNAISLGGSATLLIDAAVTASGAISGSGSLTKAGSGNLTLSSGSSNYAGGTTLSAGTVTAQNSASLGSGSITFDGGALTVDSGASPTFSNSVAMASSGTLNLTSGTQATFSGAFSGTGALAVIGVAGGAAEVLTLGNTGNSTAWSGTLAATDATLQFAGDNQLASGAITLNGGAQLTSTASTTVDNAIAIAGAATLYASTGTLTLTGVVSGSGALTTGGGAGASVRLSGSNTHSGSVSVTSATLSVSGGAALGDASAVTLSNGSTLDLQSNETIGSLAAASGNAVSLGSSRLTVGGDNTSTSYSGSISGTGGLTKTGSGTWTLGGTNTASGSIDISAGGLTVSGGSAIGNSSSVTVASGATLTLAASETIGSLAGAGAVVLGSSTLSAGGNNTSTTFSGTINGSGNLTKSGTGKLTLSGSNGYTGTTTVTGSGGTLSVTDASNISTNTITLGSGGALEVTGSNVTLVNAFTIDTGGGTISNDNALALTGVMSGVSGASFNKAGTGVLTMSAANTLPGDVVVQAGTLNLTGSLTATNAVSVLSGATLAGSGSITTANAVVVDSGGFLSPGVIGVNSGAGTLTINGDLDLFGTLQIDINGTTAGSEYDQVVVNGAVTLDSAGAALSVTHNYTPGLADTYVVIDNDASDAIVDTFTGLPEGDTLTAGGNGTVLTASYVGGTNSNDFTLTAPNNSAPVVTNLDGDSIAYTAGGTVLLDAGGNAVVSDAEDDLANWNGGSIVVQRFTGGTADPSANDVFGFAPGATFTVNGNQLQLAGLTFATFTDTGGVLTISFTGSGTPATTALVQDVVRHVNYRNDTPYGDAALRLTLADSQGATIDCDLTLTCGTIYVDQANDDADGDAGDGFSLREALARGVAQGGADTIDVVLPDDTTITLGSGVTSGAGDTLDLGDADGLTITGSTLTLGGALTITNDSGDSATLASTLAGSATLTMSGDGTLVLASTINEVSFSGDVALDGGTVSIGDDDALGSGTLQFDGGTLDVTTASATVDNDMVIGSGGGTLHAGVDWTASGVVSGSGTLDKTGAGALTLSGTSAHTGATQVVDGALAVASDANLGSGTLTLDGGQLTVSNAGTIDNDIAIGAGGAVVDNANALTLSGALTGAGTLDLVGTGTLTLTNAANASGFSGATRVLGGSLAVAGDAQLGSGSLTLNSGTLSITGATTIDNAVVLVNTALVDVAGGLAATLSGVVSGSGTLFKQGSGSLTLSNSGNSSAHTGATQVRGGTLTVAGDANLGAGAVTLNGGTLSVTGAGTIDNGIVLIGSGGTVDAAAALTLSGALSGDGPLGVQGGGAVTLSNSGNATNFTGTTTVQGGTLRVAGDANLGAGAVTLNGGTLTLTAADATIDNALVLSVSGGTVQADANATLSGAITGSGDLTKAGNAVLTLSGTSAYTGITRVQSGTLQVTGALDGTAQVDVASGATLAGTGGIGTSGSNGVVVVGAGGTLAPGLGTGSTGTLTLHHGLVFDAGAHLLAEARGSVAGSGYDQVVVEGAVTLNGGALTLDLGNYAATAGEVYTVISNDAVDAVANTFDGQPEGTIFTAADGRDLQLSYVGGDGNDIALTALNAAPVVANPLVDQGATEDSAFSFTVPPGTFTDLDTGDTLSYTATLADGSPLPSWLSFDAATRSFSGTPANGDVGAISVRVTATDGSQASTSSDFTLTVSNTNDAPTAGPIAAQAATEDGAFSFTVPPNTFTDVDAGDTLSYTATLADGSPLPSWLSFDATTRTFSGTPANGDVGAISVRVTATDGSQASASSDFTLTVSNTNDAPTAGPIAAQSATEDSAFNFTVPPDTFNDVDAGDTLSYTATLADGSPLPSWLSFDAATRTFSGTPVNGDVGAITVRVTATDGSQASASSDFTLTVSNTNDAPTAGPIAAQSATEDGAFSFTVPPGTFTDVDAGDTLSYTATLADGSPLPSWLSFDATTRTFSGTPANGDVGAISVRVTATDGSHASASSNFTLTVVNTNDAPTTIGIDAQTAAQGSAFTFTVPPDTFSDVDAGDTLSFTATLADGSPLPSWLSFDAATRTFSGTPATGDVGTINVRVTATDGSQASVASDFALRVTGEAVPPPVPPVPPPPPIVVVPPPVSSGGVVIPDIAPPVNPGVEFFTTTPAGVALDGMLRQDPISGGTSHLAPAPSSESGGTAGNSAAQQAVPQFEAVRTGGGSELSVELPHSAFTLSMPEGAVALDARLADGQPLPSWLQFDPATGQLTGRVPASVRGVIEVVLTVRDSRGQITTTKLVIHVGDTPVPTDATKPAPSEKAPARHGLGGASEPLAARPSLSEQLRHARLQPRGTIADRLASSARGERAASA